MGKEGNIRTLKNLFLNNLSKHIQLINISVENKNKILSA